MGNRRRRRRRRRHLVPIVPIWLFPENKSVYVQKIKAYVQKIKAFVSSLHKMEFVIYKEILKSGKPASGIFVGDVLRSQSTCLMKT